jgi:hypothetical protein
VKKRGRGSSKILEDQLAKAKWVLGDTFTLVDCDYRPYLNALERADFSFGDFPKMVGICKRFVNVLPGRKRPRFRNFRETRLRVRFRATNKITAAALQTERSIEGARTIYDKIIPRAPRRSVWG